MIKILGSHGNRSDKFYTTCLQISEHTVIDAGNIIYGLKEKAIDIDNIFVSHSHLDHILDIAFLCDNFLSQRVEPIKVYGLKATIKSLKKHLFNWEIWPDFSELKLELSGKKVLEFIELEYDVPLHVDGVTITPLEANHTVECCDYLIEKDGSGIVFSADTYTSDRIWEVLNSSLHVKALIVDVSFPSNLEKIANASKHLTPKLLKSELKKLKRDDVEIYINHIKSNYQNQIEKEIESIGLNPKNILLGGESIDFTSKKILKHNSQLAQIEKVKILNKIGSALSANSEITSLLDMIVSEARNLTGADAGTLYILNRKTKELHFTVVQTTSLGIHMGGVNGDIEWNPLPLYLEDGFASLKMVAATSVIEDRVINIEDVYDAKDFNFDGTREFDKSTGYRSKSMLVIPLKNHENKIIGALQLINKTTDGVIIPFDKDDMDITLSLASQAAVALTNANLIEDLENLLESFLKSIIYAIKRKSSYTANHIHKMVGLSKMLAKAIDADKSVFKDKKFTPTKLKMINLAALMHDIGKLSTPDYILDKSTKLDGLNDRVEVVKTRAWAIKKELEVEFLKDNISKEEFTNKIQEIEQNMDMLLKSNQGSEFLCDDDVKKIESISKKVYTCSGENFYLITKEEAKLFMIQKGTLTEIERGIINEHAQISLDILNKLPFPEKYEEIPSVAGDHHEKINGKGYPQGLKGDEISFESRILAIADIFEALTASDRPYKKANSLSTAMKILFFMAKDNELDRGLVKFFYESGLYMKFAKKSLKPEQIDEVNIDFSSL